MWSRQGRMIAVTVRLKRSCWWPMSRVLVAPVSRRLWSEDRAHLIAASLKVGVACIGLLFVGSNRAAPLPPSGAPEAAACSAPEYRQFDFWVGDWDAFESGGSIPVARVRVDRVLDGCALLERYEDTNGLKGQSFTIYDASR